MSNYGTKSDFKRSKIKVANIKDIKDKMPNIVRLLITAALNTKINEVKSKIPSITNLVTNVSLKAKINDVKGEILSITNLATTAALTTVENKIPNVKDLVEKQIVMQKQKILKIDISPPLNCNKFTNNILDAKITVKTLVDKSGLNKKTKKLATKKYQN